MFQYLPSKNFVISAGAVLIGLILFLAASYAKKTSVIPAGNIVAYSIIKTNADVGKSLVGVSNLEKNSSMPYKEK